MTITFTKIVCLTVCLMDEKMQMTCGLMLAQLRAMAGRWAWEPPTDYAKRRGDLVHLRSMSANASLLCPAVPLGDLKGARRNFGDDAFAHITKQRALVLRPHRL